MIAANNGHERAVELLLQRGAEVDLQDSDGWTALMCAADNGHERVRGRVAAAARGEDQQAEERCSTALMYAASWRPSRRTR